MSSIYCYMYTMHVSSRVNPLYLSNFNYINEFVTPSNSAEAKMKVLVIVVLLGFLAASVNADCKSCLLQNCTTCLPKCIPPSFTCAYCLISSCAQCISQCLKVCFIMCIHYSGQYIATYNHCSLGLVCTVLY